MFLVGLLGTGTAAAAGGAAASTAAGAAAASTAAAAGAGAAAGWGTVAGAMSATVGASIPLAPMAISSGLTFGQVLGMASTGFSLASAGASLFGGIQGQQQAAFNTELQAQQASLDAEQGMIDVKNEEIRGKQESNQIMDTLRQTIAAQRVAAGANGLDFSFGTPASLEKSTARLAEAQLSTARSDTQMNVLARRRQALVSRYNATNARISGAASGRNSLYQGISQAAGTLINLEDRSLARG
jgi:hypothetical protein